VTAPAWVFVPHAVDASKPVLLVVEPRGRAGRWAEGGLYHQLAAKGMVVVAVDVRGIGDLTPEVGRGNASYAIPHTSEEAWAWASLMLGSPLVGQRVTDLLAFVDALGSLEPARNRRIVLAAAGQLSVPALFAAALEPRIDCTYLSGGLVSYASILEFEDYRHPAANFVPGVLGVADLPDVAALAAPRRVILAGAVDGAGKSVAGESVRKAYSAASNVEVRGEAKWDGEALLGL
jgi:hypothetical protein